MCIFKTLDEHLQLLFMLLCPAVCLGLNLNIWWLAVFDNGQYTIYKLQVVRLPRQKQDNNRLPYCCQVFEFWSCIDISYQLDCLYTSFFYTSIHALQSIPVFPLDLSVHIASRRLSSTARVDSRPGRMVQNLTYLELMCRKTIINRSIFPTKRIICVCRTSIWSKNFWWSVHVMIFTCCEIILIWLLYFWTFLLVRKIIYKLQVNLCFIRMSLFKAASCIRIFGRLTFSNECGLVIVDVAQKCLIMVITTSELYGKFYCRIIHCST